MKCYTNPDADIFILPDNKIQVRKLDFSTSSTEVLGITGEDASDLILILPVIWEKGIAKQQFIDFFDGKYSGDQVDETILMLKTAGIISEKEIISKDLLLPFNLNKISNNISFFRIDCLLFIIQAGDEEAQIMFDKISRRWRSECDVEVFRGLLNSCLKIFPARKIDNDSLKEAISSFLVNNTRVINMKIKFADDKLFLEKHDPFENIQKVIGSSSSYWGDFISKAIYETGIIANVEEMKKNLPPFVLSKYFFLSSHILTELDGNAVTDSQVGSGNTPEEACGKAVMESLERYCCQKKPVKLIRTNISQLSGSNIINPDHLARYLNKQLEQVNDIRNFRESDEDFWTEIFDRDGNSWMIPASHIWYCFHQSDFINGRSLFWANTNGAAAHMSFEQAVFSAIRELIERDAVMIWWLNRLSPPAIRRSFIRDEQRIVIDKIENFGFEIRMLNMTLDLLPVVMAVARNKNGNEPYFFCGASCHENILIACEKALTELEQAVWSKLNQKAEDVDVKCVDSPLDHEIFYLNPKNGVKLNFLFNGCVQDVCKKSVQFKSFRDLIAYLDDKKFNVFLKDITCEEIRKAGLEIFVVKTVIPCLVPITFGFMREALGLPRIYDLPVKLGLRKSPLTESEIIENYQLHFFS